MKKKILLAATSLMLTFSMLVTGCGTTQKPSDNKGTNTPTQTAAPSGPQKVTINLGSEPPQMNPILSTDSTSGNVMRHVYEGLVRLGKDGKPIPGVAEKWESADNGMKWTFTLRDAKWADGSPITAEDFKFTYITMLKKETAAKYAYLAYYIKNAEAFYQGKVKEDEVGIKVLDPKKLEITLEKPAPFILDLLAYKTFYPVQKSFYEKQDGGKKFGAEAANMSYNGPWMIKEWKHEDSIVLVKNPNYWNAKEIKLDEIKMLMIKDSNTALNTFRAGDADMIGLTGDQVNMVKADGLTPVSYQDGSSWYFEFNLKDKVMSNLNIRKALTYSIDRNTFIKGVLKNNSLPATGLTNPVIFDDKGDSFAKGLGNMVKDNDAAGSKELFEKGLKELGLDKAPKIELVVDDTDAAKKNAQAFQEMWKKTLGFEITITSIPFAARLERMTNKDFSIVMAGWSADYNDPISFLDMLETNGGNNHTSYADPEYDKMIKAAQTEKDKTKRMDILKQMEKKLMADLPLGPIYFRQRDYVTKPYFKGIVRQFGQDIDMYWAYVEGKK